MKFFQSLLDAILPDHCVVCGRELTKGEDYLCLHCHATFPRVRIPDIHDNEIHKRLMAKGNEIDRGASLMIYRRESPYARLIHTAKYGGRQKLCRHLGKMIAQEFRDQGFFEGIDLIVPIPMHIFKKISRGYNQSEEVAAGIGAVTGIPVATDCLSARRHSTQTRKNAMQRLEAASDIFRLPHPGDWKDVGHILLVDDVITTGATMLACSRLLHDNIPGVKISVVSAALTVLQ